LLALKLGCHQLLNLLVIPVTGFALTRVRLRVSQKLIKMRRKKKTLKKSIRNPKKKKIRNQNRPVQVQPQIKENLTGYKYKVFFKTQTLKCTLTAARITHPPPSSPPPSILISHYPQPSPSIASEMEISPVNNESSGILDLN